MEVNVTGAVVNLLGMTMGVIMGWYSYRFLHKMRRSGALIWKSVGSMSLMFGVFLFFAQFWLFLQKLFLDNGSLYFALEAVGTFSLFICAYFGSLYVTTLADKLEEVLV